MRLTLLAMVALYPFLSLLPQTHAEQAMTLALLDPSAVREVLNQVEYISLRGQQADCDVLSPLPLYVGAPSADDWSSFCTAVVRHDAAACARIPGMLTPDLHSFCSALFSQGSSPTFL